MEDKTENPRNNESQVTDGADSNTVSMQAKMGAGASNTLANSVTQSETPAMQGTPASDQKASSSESLVDSEMSVGKGNVGGPTGQQPNKEATPEDVQPGAGESQEQQERQQHSDSEPSDQYGGNFGNSVQDIYQDDDRHENQISGASRGEFGTQDHGNTQGGYGNQFRATNESGNYTLSNGPQENSYQNYSGRDDSYRQGQQSSTQVVYGQDNLPYEQLQPNAQAGNDGSTYLNDNGSGYGRSRGYSADYGTSSLTDSNMGTTPTNRSDLGAQQRNQNEDRNSSRGGYDNQDRTQGGNGQQTSRDEREDSYNQAAGIPDPNSRSTYQQPSARDEEENKTNRSGSGDGQGDYNGKTTEGFGSQGGSYDDEYASSDPNSKQGAPVRGDYDNADKAKNYGAEKREEYRAEDKEDYGSAPRRNQGRDAADSNV
ncbi:hypothetical protein [Hymenobacter crusticola]|uniref:Uncharacterized protein n=1 Tax=Hymenobacter crusticola TaxID=1770526 RepID=A0A243WJU7_9BACT|nr:hypothetical protein [Hymenobacter crusticola]OUJ75374.1 hypothetical protein BXP70_05000 [Hymenobacter crusticola]